MQSRMLAEWVRRAVGLVVVCGVGASWAQVQGAGATFPSKVYLKWAQSFERQTGDAVRYAPTGSGDGVLKISSRSVDFAGTDSPLSAQELATRKLVQLPMVVGGIVPVVNLAGVRGNKLVLNAQLLADIMSGHVRAWNDPRIASLNPGLKLPSDAIVRIVRADKSGTTEGLTRYLADGSAQFKREVGIGQLPAWPGAVERAEGNDGVVKALKARPGAISYVSYDRVLHDGLSGVRLRNAANQDVAASEAAFRAAVLDSDMARQGDDLASLMNRPSALAWPITQTTFVLLDQTPKDSARAAKAMRFVYWCFMRGDELTRDTGFAPLPINMQARLAKRLATVVAADGKSLHYMSN